ncbi:MAG: RluA family pseudouridine synthase [Fibrobacteraceae bacterium]|nr:RluA family pseudouridine synthase [Fibrobacteraceae bacterium]
MSEVPKTLFFESTVYSEHRGLSFLEELCKRFTYHSAEEWKAKIESGCVTLNGNQAKAHDVVQTKDKVVYRVENYTEPPVPTDFETLFEDDEFLIVAKPAGIPVHHTGHIFYNTFTGVVRRAFDNDELSPMHRLDRDTGGIMLFAKTRDTAARFERNLDCILLRKKYLAVVRGNFLTEEFLCEQPLREDPSSEIRLKMYPFADGKPCKTKFRKLGHFETPVANVPVPFSVVEAELLSGRKHQIRAHLSSLGFPVVGDKLYSFDGFYYKKLIKEGLSNADFVALGARTQMLYAYKAFIRLPYWSEGRWFSSLKFTPEMNDVIALLPQLQFSCEASD